MNGPSVLWDFPHAGSFKVTLRLIDSGGLYKEYFVNVNATGIHNDSDYDNDGLPNDYEEQYGFNKYDPIDASLDEDGDQLTNLEEFKNGTDPNILDTDRDGVPDNTDYDPLNKDIWDPPVEERMWYDDTLTLILLIATIAIILILIIAVVTLYIIRSRKKSQEEEEKRRLAEEMQKSMYEDQDLYKDLPALQQSPQLAETPAPMLPPQPQGLDDIFGGAGVLPTGAPPPTQQGQKPPQQQGNAGDLSDLLG